jgi:hypothetical protein
MVLSNTGFKILKIVILLDKEGQESGEGARERVGRTPFPGALLSS